MTDCWTRECRIVETVIHRPRPDASFNDKPAKRKLVPLLLSTVVISRCERFAIHARLRCDYIVGFSLEEAEVRPPLNRLARYWTNILPGSGSATRGQYRDHQQDSDHDG